MIFDVRIVLTERQNRRTSLPPPPNSILGTHNIRPRYLFHQVLNSFSFPTSKSENFSFKQSHHKQCQLPRKNNKKSRKSNRIWYPGLKTFSVARVSVKPLKIKHTTKGGSCRVFFFYFCRPQINIEKTIIKCRSRPTTREEKLESTATCCSRENYNL